MLPHTKRCLRQAALGILEAYGMVDCPTSTFSLKAVQLNFKKLEWGKNGKNGRIVCDLGVTASIRGGWYLDLVKEAFAASDHATPYGLCRFLKSPDIGSLRATFVEMYSENRFIYFSDDSSVSFKCLDGMFWANLDIASCDSSQGPAVFNALYEIAEESERYLIDALIAQCAMPARLGHGEDSLSVAPVAYYEYSGTVLTTTLNNIANLCIGSQLMSLNTLNLTRAECGREVNKILADCGWSVTIQVCTHFEQIQFLKHSPCFGVGGTIEAALNLGVILRCLGQKTWDLPGRGDLFDRAVAFNSGLVRGMCHAGNHSLLAALRGVYNRNVSAVYNSDVVETTTGTNTTELHECSLVRRYGLTLPEYHELLEQIRSRSFFIDCRASKVIMQTDYGL